MGARDDQLLLEKLKSLPPERRAEVEDFIDFLRNRADEQRAAHVAVHVAVHASEPAFKEIWNNPDDAEYDRL